MTKSRRRTNRRIAVFLPDLIGAGAQRVLFNLALGFDAHEYPVDLVLSKAQGVYLAEVPESIRVIDLSAPRLVASLPRLARYLKREQPSALLAGPANANLIAIWARQLAKHSSPIRLVITEHITSAHTRHASNWRDRLLPRLMKRFYHWADEIVAVSQGIADDLARETSIPQEQIRVIYNPVIVPTMRKKAKASLDHPWFQPNRPPVVLGVGRLAKQKNFRLLIDAVARVQATHPIRLIILGEGPLEEELKAHVRALGLENDICFPGFCDNPYAYMAHCALFVLSSSWEGLPTVLIEALYSGAPVIATDCPSGPREILADGRFGRLIPVNDLDALACAIEQELSRSRHEMNPKSWQPFEIETITKQYLEILSRQQSCHSRTK